jgi:predicted CxxxxCH...CXXCH cytochrome family protein
MRPAPPRAALAILLLALALSCAKARPEVGGTRRCVNWKETIGPAFTDRCQSCHAGASPAGSYGTGSYTEVLGGGSDAVSNAIAGDASSRLVTTLDPTTSDSIHRGFADLFPDVRDWVVDCQVSFVQSSIHRGGIMNPGSPEFHGQVIRDHQYKFDTCQQCHGDDFAGGKSGVSCVTCHSKGPTDCSTCHAAIAASGSHGHHLGGGTLGTTYGCQECHVVPTVYTDVGHIFLQDGSVDPAPAEVKLGAMAALTPTGTTRAGPPTYDAATQSCANVYCHGALLADSAATNTHPSWKAAGMGQADCGSCHGLPPNHTSGSACASCHPSVAALGEAGVAKIVAPALHIDGKIEFADPATACTGCHGGVAGPAPPRALDGGTSPASPGVGAHQAHLQGSAHLRGPIACAECHLVPDDVTSAGHFPGHSATGAGGGGAAGAPVFPAAAGVGTLASTDGATPRWDPATATCATVYCHGGGAKLATDTVAGVDRAPVWTATGGLVCGSACHGLPPAFAPHLPTMIRTDCASCHPRTVDPSGAIIVSGAPGAVTSAHMNGVLDVAP